MTTLELSPQQLRILRSAAVGNQTRDTATDLGCGPESVKSQKTLILLKLGARNMAHAVHLGHERGLIA